MSQTCGHEKLNTPIHVQTPLIEGDVTLTKRAYRAKPDPSGKCVIRDLMMALDSQAKELGMDTLAGAKLNHFCSLCGMFLEGGIQFEIPQDGNFDDSQTDNWGLGWSNDND